MKRITAIMIVSLLASCFAANGQGLLRSLGERAKNAVENKSTRLRIRPKAR